jgi:hypothetical protein
MNNPAIEIPCVRCGNAAVQLNLSGAVSLVPAKFLIAARGAARRSGTSIDLESPSLGLELADIAATIEATCIECVDAAATAARHLAENIADAANKIPCQACRGTGVLLEQDGGFCWACSGSGVVRKPVYNNPEYPK